MDAAQKLGECPAGDGSRRDNANRHCPHGPIEGLRVRIRINGELGEPQVTSSRDDVVEQQTADALPDDTGIDEHHAQHTLRRVALQGREADNAAVLFCNSGPAARKLTFSEREFLTARLKKLSVIPPIRLRTKG